MRSGLAMRGGEQNRIRAGRDIQSCEIIAGHHRGLVRMSGTRAQNSSSRSGGQWQFLHGDRESQGRLGLTVKNQDLTPTSS